MIPELILDEERSQNYLYLMLTSALSAFLGFCIANLLFTTNSGIIMVLIAGIPLVFPLTEYFLNHRDSFEDLKTDTKIYMSLFVGAAIVFYFVGWLSPETLDVQYRVLGDDLTVLGVTGAAHATWSMFIDILLNNLGVFIAIFALSVLVGSAGAFILMWNASVLGMFLGSLSAELSGSWTNFLLGSEATPSPIAYLPHATLEMSGFVIAGVVGTVLSAKLYNKETDREKLKPVVKMFSIGILAILLGALLEAA